MPDVIREAGRADAVAASAALAVVGAALAWWQPGQGGLRSLGLALVFLGPLGILATLTLMPMADPDRIEAELARSEPAPVPAIPVDDSVDDHIDEPLPELDLQHSVRA